MNKTVKLLIMIIVFAAIIVGASLLYNNLAKDAPNTLAPTGTENPDGAEDAANDAAPEDAPDAAPDTNPDTTTETDENAASDNAADENTEGENAENEEPSLSVAPDITVYDINGNPKKLSDLRGKPVVLNFWASWCGPCRSEMPVFEDAYKKYGEDVHFFMVNYTNGRETVETASAFIEEMGYTFPVYYDPDFSASAVYGVYSIPVTYFIDAEGHGIAMAKGAINADIMEQGLGMLNK